MQEISAKSNHDQNLLIIGAGIEACEGINLASDMGLGLIIVDGNSRAPGFAKADHIIQVSTYDGEAIAKYALTLVENGIKIHGVIAMCADVPMSVAIVARALDLPGLSLQSAHWVADKLAMKYQLQKMGIPIPRFCAVTNKASLHACANMIGFPVVIKPVDSRGARGVQLIEQSSQLDMAWTLAHHESPTGRVMLEEYLDGPQFSTETLIDNSQCYTLGFADRNYEWLERTKPFIIENGGDAPTASSVDVRSAVIVCVEQAALALGISSGVAKGDMVYTDTGPKVIEIAGRLSGGYFSTTQIPLACGVNFVEKAIKLALGQSLSVEEVTPTQQQAVAIRYLDLPEGKVKSVINHDVASTAPGVQLLNIFITPGSIIAPLSNHTQRSGFVITTATNKQEAIELAQTALSLIKVTYE
ncbi:ATP-grasp domain-containing protein [Shewanella sp. AC34-MNA-CIBAN-0136]|uniref:ATP-grasp domain-containing protein n=1 Tax=Shewanella sp. AC34-MNA-CIBAN-0136 TaxID=3140463 RepID=UPI0033270CE9